MYLASPRNQASLHELRASFFRPLAEPGILVSGRGQINEEPQCTKVHEDSEFIFDEPRKQKTKVMQEVF